MSSLKILTAARDILDLIYIIWSTSYDITLLDLSCSVSIVLYLTSIPYWHVHEHSSHGIWPAESSCATYNLQSKLTVRIKSLCYRPNWHSCSEPNRLIFYHESMIEVQFIGLLLGKWAKGYPLHVSFFWWSVIYLDSPFPKANTQKFCTSLLLKHVAHHTRILWVSLSERSAPSPSLGGVICVLVSTSSSLRSLVTLEQLGFAYTVK
jgi:hypothetical protein